MQSHVSAPLGAAFPSSRSPKPSRLDAYWFWGEIPSEQQILEQLCDFAAQGFTTIYIQARLSLPRALYLSPGWLRAYRRAVEIMGQLGLRAGLYDDYAWSSGQAGGRTVEGADHLRETHLFWVTSEAEDATISGLRATLAASLGPAARAWLHEGGTPQAGDWRIVGAVSWDEEGLLRDITGEVDLIDCNATGLRARRRQERQGGEARWSLFVSARIVNSRVINYLMPEAGQRFVEVGLQPYADELGPLIPRVVDHLFFDQPAPVLYDWVERSGDLGNSLLWSEALARELAQAAPPCEVLAALITPVGPQTDRLRSHAYRAYTRLFQQGFLAPLRAFCDDLGLKLTGHEILPHVGQFALNGGFRSIDPRVALAADFFGTDDWRDIVAVDANNLEPQLAPVLGRSLARRSGQAGCLCELYVTATRTEIRAAGQWEMTPQALRQQILCLHLLGAARVILHALFADEGDSRPEPLENMRFDFAPGYNLQPWWPVMGEIAREAATFADFIEGAEPRMQVALFYPYEDALCEGPRGAYGALFGAWVEALLADGIMPLIVDEAALKQVLSDTAGHPQLWGAQIGALILPTEEPPRFHDPETAMRLAQMQALGVLLEAGRWPEQGLASIRQRLSVSLPVCHADEGVRALIAGCDDEGCWRIALLNETLGAAGAEITVAGRRHRIETAAQEACCLRFGADGLRIAEAEEAVDDPTAELLMQLDEGWQFRAGHEGAARPISVTQGWEHQGWAAFSGLGQYELGFEISPDQQGALVIDLPGVSVAVRVWLDERDLGWHWKVPLRVDLGVVSAGRHGLRLEVANTAANAFYAETPYAGDIWPDASGLTSAPRLLRKTGTTA